MSSLASSNCFLPEKKAQEDVGWESATVHEAHLNFRKMEAIVLLFLVAGSVLWRISLISLESLNPDEVFVVSGAFRARTGLQPYLDYVVALAPLIYGVYSPLIGWVGETPRYLDYFRWVHYLLSLALLAILFILVRRLYNARTGLWVLGILNSFLFFIERTVHVRPDTPALLVVLISLYVLTYSRKYTFNIGGEVLAAVGMALGFCLHVTIIFCVAPIFLWLVLNRTKCTTSLGRSRSVLLFGFAFLVAYGFFFSLMFGRNTLEALLYYPRMFQLEKLYQQSFDPHTTKIFVSILFHSFLNWLLLCWAVLAVNLRWLAGRLPNPYTRLFVLLTDMGILFLLARGHTFEQHYFQLVLFGSLPTALIVLEWDKRVTVRYGKRSDGVMGSLVALTLTISALVGGASISLSYKEHDKIDARYAQEARKHFEGTGDSLAGSAVRAWLKGKPFLLDPFSYRSKKHREAQIKCILAHAEPGEIVFSDWLNPPYRPLPIPYHHGFMISLFYESQQLPHNPGLVGLLRHYDPYYCIEERSGVERMIRLLDATQPALILLDGSLGQLFVFSDTFSQWISDRYQLFLEPESASVFALHRPGEKRLTTSRVP